MSPSDPYRVDPVIVARNSASDLPKWIGELPAFARVIVVDNASTDDSVKVAERTGATVVALDENRGFAAAANIGVGHVSATVTLLLNPDVVVAPGAIEHCCDVLLSEPSIALVGPNTRQPNGSAEPPAARADRRALHIVLESLGLNHVHPWFDLQTIRARASDRDVDAVNGAFMLVRTNILRSLGGLDETVFICLEDSDLCRRVRDAGYRVRFVAGANAVHAYGTSTRHGDQAAQARAYVHGLDADIEFMRRYQPRPSAGVAVWAFIVRSLLGLVVSVWKPERRLRYRTALTWTLHQLRGRRPPPAV